MAASLVTYRLHGGKIRDARIGVGGAESSPRRVPEAEAALNGSGPTDAAFRAAAEAAAKAIDPLEDHQTNAEYRRDLVRAVVRRTSTPMPSIGATLYARSCGALWSRASREWARHPRLRNDLGRTRHPSPRRPRAYYRPGPAHGGPSRRTFGALRARACCRGETGRHPLPSGGDGDTRGRPRRREEDS